MLLILARQLNVRELHRKEYWLQFDDQNEL